MSNNPSSKAPESAGHGNTEKKSNTRTLEELASKSVFSCNVFMGGYPPGYLIFIVRIS